MYPTGRTQSGPQSVNGASDTGSYSPPDSPQPMTPGQGSPPFVGMSTISGSEDRKSGHDSADDFTRENGRGLPPLSINTSGPSGGDSPHSLTSPSAPHFTGRSFSPLEQGGVFASASSSHAPDGYRERSGHRSISDNGFPIDEKADTPIVKPPSPYDQPYSSRPLTSKGLGVPPAAQGWFESTPVWLGMYFFFNLGLTLFNKLVLVSFPFPYTLTGLHALSASAGCYIALEREMFVPARLTQKESIMLGAFSVLYTINIAVSNISLQLVTVPFHQVVRAAAPMFTMFIAALLLRQKFSLNKILSLLPVVAGVGFATYGDYYFTTWGLVLTMLGTFLAALKTVVTNIIQTGGRLKLHPLDLLMRMSPLAFIQCVLYGWWTGELDRVRKYGATQMTSGKAFALLINGIIACGLNIVSFTANKKAGPLTMTVSANCKQVLTILLAVFLFNLNINFTNAIGILLTLSGGGLYAYVEYTEKRQQSKLSSVKGAEKA